MKKFAFTISEVLITLGIIGVVAVITLSPIINNIRNRGFVEKFLKTYSLLQQITRYIEQEEGIPIVEIYDSMSNSDFVNLYLKYLKTSDKRVRTRDNYIYSKVQYKYLNGDAPSKADYVYSYFSFVFPQLDDGTLIHFTGTGKEINIDWNLRNTGARGLFLIDVNGFKEPNQYGRDVFVIWLTNSGKITVLDSWKDAVKGTWHKDCNPNGSDFDGRGYTCSYKIVTEGKMNY